MPNPEQLKFIQAAISRLAGNSFLLKGWTVTLVAGLTAFAKADADTSFAWIAVFVVIVLGLLDAYYLALERAFRELYATESQRSESDSWTVKPRSIGTADIVASLGRPSVWLLHGVALAVAVAVAAGA